MRSQSKRWSERAGAQRAGTQRTETPAGAAGPTVGSGPVREPASHGAVVVAVALVLLGAHVVLSSNLAAAATPTCFGRRATIVGTNRDPNATVFIKGTARSDVIVGLEGSDRIQAAGGDDLVCAGGGDDYVVAGAGDDKVKGRGDFDTILAGRGDDRLWGERGADGLSGGPGQDALFGGSGHEDSLVGGAGDDLLRGGPGYDRAEFWDSPAGVHVDLRSGSALGYGKDTLASIEGLVGSNGDDVLVGDNLSNDLQAGGGNDVVRARGSSGDGGADILRSAGGDNVLDGGRGPDVVSYNLNPWRVVVDLEAGLTTTEGFGSDTLRSIEHLTGSKDDDTLLGDGKDNVIMGNGGDDKMDGRGGIDEAAFLDSRVAVTVDLAAGSANAEWWGSDSLVNFENVAGSALADNLFGDGSANLIWGGPGGDVMSGFAGPDSLVGAAGFDSADGGSEIDVCDAESERECESDPAGSKDRTRESMVGSLAAVGSPWAGDTALKPYG